MNRPKRTNAGSNMRNLIDSQLKAGTLQIGLEEDFIPNEFLTTTKQDVDFTILQSSIYQ